MPVIAGGFMAVKTVTFFPGNKGLPTHLATIELLAAPPANPSRSWMAASSPKCAPPPSQP